MNEVRLLAALLSALAAFFLFIRFNDRAKDFTPGLRAVGVLIVVGYVIAAYGLLEAFVQQAEMGARAFLWTANCTAILGALWHYRRRT